MKFREVERCGTPPLPCLRTGQKLVTGEKNGQMGRKARVLALGLFSDHAVTEVMATAPLQVLRKSSVSLFASRAALGGRSARRPDGEQGLVEEKRLSER